MTIKNKEQAKIKEKLAMLEILTKQKDCILNIKYEFISQSTLRKALKKVNDKINEIWDSK